MLKTERPDLEYFPPCTCCGRPRISAATEGSLLCDECQSRVPLTAAAAQRQAREHLQALLDRQGSNTMLTLYQAARDSVEALVRLEEAGTLTEGVAANLARRMDASRDTVLSLALGRRLGDGEGGSLHSPLDEQIRGFLADLEEIGRCTEPEGDPLAAPAPWEASEHRRHLRTTRTVPVRMQPGDQAGLCRNVSAGGAFVSCSPAPEAGQKLTLIFGFGTEQRCTPARVCWADGHGIGVEFAHELLDLPLSL
jgi:hypothetical protein